MVALFLLPPHLGRRRGEENIHQGVISLRARAMPHSKLHTLAVVLQIHQPPHHPKEYNSFTLVENYPKSLIQASENWLLKKRALTKLCRSKVETMRYFQGYLCVLTPCEHRADNESSSKQIMLEKNCRHQDASSA